LLVTSFTIFARRAPSQVSPRVSVWLFVTGVNFLGLFAVALSPPGIRLAPRALTLPLGILLALLTVFIRFNLGRNIGLVPARRQLVTSGAYRWVRHPIYAANILAFAVLLLSRFSWTLAGILVALLGGYAAKAWLEESFLSQEEDYRAYRQAVRWRFIPFLYYICERTP
jgi:protein-S-isoprenylcysteine O-methyltransferase Ste14